MDYTMSHAIDPERTNAGSYLHDTVETYHFANAKVGYSLPPITYKGGDTPTIITITVTRTDADAPSTTPCRLTPAPTCRRTTPKLPTFTHASTAPSRVSQRLHGVLDSFLVWVVRGTRFCPAQKAEAGGAG